MAFSSNEEGLSRLVVRARSEWPQRQQASAVEERPRSPTSADYHGGGASLNGLITLGSISVQSCAGGHSRADDSALGHFLPQRVCRSGGLMRQRGAAAMF